MNFLINGSESDLIWNSNFLDLCLNCVLRAKEILLHFQSVKKKHHSDEVILFSTLKQLKFIFSLPSSKVWNPPELLPKIWKINIAAYEWRKMLFTLSSLSHDLCVFFPRFAFNLFHAIYSYFYLNTFLEDNLPLIRWKFPGATSITHFPARDFFLLNS